MVVILHVLGQGGILQESHGIQSNIAWGMEIAAYCAVNCYALITGYVCYGREQHFSRFFALWMQVVFYCVLITSLFYIFSPGSIGIKEFIKALMPVTRNQYWYFTAYAVLFAFLPFLNRMIAALNSKSLILIVLIIAFVESILPSFTFSSGVFNNAGYGVIWLACLYVIGSAINRLSVVDRVKSKTAFFGYVGCVVLTWLSYVSIEFVTNIVFGKARGMGAFVSYCSPFVFMMSIFLFLACVQMKFGGWGRRLIAFFAPLSFAVYLIHTNPLVFNWILAGRFAFLGADSWYAMVGGVIGISIGIYLMCSLFDYVRACLFRICRVDALSQKMEALLIDKWGNRVLLWITQWVEKGKAEEPSCGVLANKFPDPSGIVLQEPSKEEK